MTNRDDVEPKRPWQTPLVIVSEIVLDTLSGSSPSTPEGQPVPGVPGGMGGPVS